MLTLNSWKVSLILGVQVAAYMDLVKQLPDAKIPSRREDATQESYDNSRKEFLMPPLSLGFRV